MQCLCTTTDGDNTGCVDPKYAHAHVEYYGECREIPACRDDELEDFPRRMREWLFNVMTELAEREELSEHYAGMLDEEDDQSRRWSNAAVWKWCDLDGHPADNVVSRHELFPVKAPLKVRVGINFREGIYGLEVLGFEGGVNAQSLKHVNSLPY